MRLAPAVAVVAVLTLAGACEDSPAHCRLPTVEELPAGDAEHNEWWLPGPLDVRSTLAWPECPPFDSSTAARADGARITYPARHGRVADGSWPIILFGHANSVRVCNPTDRYRSLHEQWASWGWIVYSVDASEQNCHGEYDVERMRERIAQHEVALDDLRRRNEDPGSPFYHRLDLDLVVAAGHSRGGTTAVVLASEDERYAGAIALQAGNPSRFKLGDTYTTRPVLGVTAELDRDLRFPHVDLTEELAQGRYSWHTILGGTHAQASDGLQHRDVDPRGIDRADQIAQSKYLTTAFLAAEFGVWDGSGMHAFDRARDVLYSPMGAGVSRNRWAPGFVSRWSRGEDAWLQRFDDGAPNRGICDGLRRCEVVAAYSPDEPDEHRRGFRLPSALLLEADEHRVGSFTMPADVGPSERPRRFQARVRAVEPGTDFEVIFWTATKGVVATAAHIAPGLGERFTQLDASVPVGSLDEVSVVVVRGALIVDDMRFTSP